MTFTLAERDGATEVALDHSGFSDDPEHAPIYDRHDQGWRGFLANLKSVLEGGADHRAAMGVKSQART